MRRVRLSGGETTDTFLNVPERARKHTPAALVSERVAVIPPPCTMAGAGPYTGGAGDGLRTSWGANRGGPGGRPSFHGVEDGR